uniref:Ion transport domain-containing protein n=1 Tax=Anopheles coluzzii TaxID=1518534 RepID=A0A8W7PWK3_ANOCL
LIWGHPAALIMAQGEAQLLMEQQERSRAALRQERRTLETFFEREFKDTLAVIPPTDESVAKWDQLLHDERLKRLEELVDLMKLWDAPKTIPEPKSFLHYARLQPVLAQMLEDIARYRTYLDRFIERFQAENECIVPKHNPQNKSDTANPSAPIHYAALQLDEDFLEWLLARSATDINLRNSFKQTALTLLCEEYVQCMRKQMQACPPGRLGKIRTVVLRLLKAKADFNICSSHMKLPFELLLKHCETHDETRLFVEQCVELVPCALAISSVNERNERVVGFYNNNPNVQVTVELLELFLRHNDRSNFTTHLAGFEIDASNVKKVIRLLLHTACDQKMADCVRLIVDRGERHIFKVLPRKPGRNAAAKEGPVAEEGANSVELSRRFGWQESIDVQKGSELEHRVELKGLLKKVCLMADLPLLQLLLAKISDLIVLNDDPLLVVTLAKAYDYKRRCIEVDSKRSIPDRNVIRFNLQGFHSPALSMTSAVSADGTPAASDRSRNKRSSWKLIQRVDQTYCQPHKFTRTVTEMTTLRQIAQSKELKRLLVHPVVYTFIMVKWTRLCHWNYLNLLLTALTIIFFGNYSLTACSVEGPSTVLWLLSLLGVVCVAIRETLQLLFLRRSYLSFENAQDLINAVAMSVVLANGCNGLLSSFVESELISISKKVMLLEQYERGVANVYPGWLRRCFPRPFFAEYDCRIHVKTKEYRKIEVHLRELSTKAGKGTAPVNPGGAAALNNAKSRLHGSSQCSVQIPPSGKPAKQKVVGKPLPKIPWIPQGDSCNFIFDVRVFRLALFMRLDQSIVDEALAIIERQQALASIQLTVKSTPTPDTPRYAASVAPAGKKRSKEPTQNEEMQRELLEVKTQLKTVLELLRRKENQEKRKDKRQAKSLKRKGQRRVQKKSKKAIPEAEPMGDQ